jgi:hypothetical protein
MGQRYLKSAFLLLTSALFAQQPSQQMNKKAYQAQSSSTFSYRVEDQDQVIEITNVAFEVAGSLPGRQTNEYLVLRKTVKTKQAIDEIGAEASTTIEAWPVGVDFMQKPIYSTTVQGVDPTTLNNEVFQVSRGLEDTPWWSVYKLTTGERLFDTYVPLVQFSTTRDVETLRYVGLDVPGDDTPDKRLKAPNVVAVLSYASRDRVIREALITCDNPKQAIDLRSFAEASRTISYSGHSLRIAISENFPSAPATVAFTIPIVKDDLDLAHTQAPAGIHATAWKR